VIVNCFEELVTFSMMKSPPSDWTEKVWHGLSAIVTVPKSSWKSVQVFSRPSVYFVREPSQSVTRSSRSKSTSIRSTNRLTVAFFAQRVKIGVVVTFQRLVFCPIATCFHSPPWRISILEMPSPS
jgi:hypothetical protein